MSEELMDLIIDTEAPDDDALAEGVYDVCITKTTVKTPKSGKGRMLEIEFTLDNKMRVWELFNLIHENPLAQGLAKKKFKELLRAAGIKGQFNPGDHKTLRDKMLKVKIFNEEYNGRKIPKVSEFVAFEKKEDDFKL